jgi:hypothetical protein
MRTKLCMYKNTCILKVLPYVVTAEVEALLLGNKLSYACVKEVCRLLAEPRFDTFHQLIIVDRKQFFR